MIHSPDDEQRLAVVVPLFAPRRDTQPGRNRTVVAACDEDRIAAARAESMRRHPSNGGK